MTANFADARRSLGRGFSLIELLVVILIIAIVIAIIIPALGGARTAARRASTAGLMTQVTSAAEKFSQDHGGTMPGYFTPQEMASNGNTDPQRGGFTAMENALLDLIGDGAIVGEAGLSDGGGGAEGSLVGPFGNVGNSGKGGLTNVRVDFDKLGAGQNVYLKAGADVLRPVDGQAGLTSHQQFPDVVDAFGNPVLAWVENHAAPRKPLDVEEFAAYEGRDGSARYYWASNAGWLNSQAMGKGGENQVDQSLLGNEGQSAAERLTAVLGNPNFPTPMDFNASNVLPAASRGAFVVHSAGPDGVFFGVKDPGAKAIGVGDANRGDFTYARNFFTPAGQRLRDANGNPATVDLIEGFDDQISATGN